MAIYQVQNEVLPEGICELITSEQARLNIFSENQYVDVPETNTGIYISATPPTDPPTDNAHDLAWLELDGNGRQYGFTSTKPRGCLCILCRLALASSPIRL